MRRLYVLRHAKSDWGTGGRDHARPLNARGVRSAKAIGRILGEADEQPNLILSSTAKRAASTAWLVAEAAGWDGTVRTTDDLYLASVEGTLRTIADLEVDRLMIVGHQPTWGSLVSHLTGASVQIKTATVVALDTPSTWGTLRERSCEIAFVLQPRLFTG